LLVWAEATPEDGVAPLVVAFTAETEGGTPPLRLTWVFGDGTPESPDRNPIHTYAVPGTYRAELRVADASGDADSDWVEVTVTPTPSPAPPPAH
jgi:PKD repeat protein